MSHRVMTTTVHATRGWRAVPALALLISLAIWPLLMQQAGAEAATEAPEEVYALPPITVIDTETLLDRLKKERGKVVVVNFWATWCPPCVTELPEFVKLYRAYRDKNVVLVSASADHPDTLESRIKPFVAAKKLPFPVYVVGASSPDELGKALKVDWDGALPATFVFDGEGKLRKQWLEEITIADMERVIGPLMKGALTGEGSPAETASEPEVARAQD